MQLINENNRYIALSTFAEKDIPKGAGFRWDPETKKWWTDDVRKAQKLAQFADDNARNLISIALLQKQEIIEDSKRVSVIEDFPVPSGLSYLGYQKGGIAYGMKRQNVLIGDDMGLGKTIQAIGIFNASPEMKKVLVICPASLKLNWKREFAKWSVRSVSIEVIKPNTKLFPVSDIVIINYDSLKKWHIEIRATEWDYMIIDEAHYLKNGKAIRTKEIFGFQKTGKPEETVTPIVAKKTVCLTGTPIPNRPAEGWTLFHALAPETFKSWGYYMKRYAAGVQTKYGWDVSGASNLEELQEKLRESIMVRRLKSDVLKELPAKRRQVIEITVDKSIPAVEKQWEMWNEKEEKLTDLRVQLEVSKVSEDMEVYKMTLKLLEEAIGVSFQDMARLRHELGVEKVPYAIEHIQECFESGVNKIVVFAHHKDVINKVAEAFPGITVIVNGDISIENRQKAVDSFQNDQNIKLFIGNFQAAGVGLTLTASSHVICIEEDWVPGNITQAEDRCHRIGQLNSVLVQHLVFENSLDVEMVRRVIEKQEIIEKALDGFELDITIADKIEQPIKEEQKKIYGKNVTVTIKEVEEQIPQITLEQINIVHTGLKMIAGMCDFAEKLDGMGFNKIDAGIGHKLASLVVLTPRQAILGKKLVTKYRRQLSQEMNEEIKKIS